MDAPYIGMPATICIGSDKYAGVITGVSKTLKIVTVKDEMGEYRFTRHPNGNYYRKRVYYLMLGIARDYLDPSF